ncbi:type VI-C CRISPR-associated RNA-guided ribonuclease Cas13c [Sedimentibacter sp. LTW-03]|uniref:type VI-C CRISPR-associated RNA-guided ribonuclease Cas13c n=1 Tax=Sedimentibacter sp. LTW-03 TaxID=3453406 RepID=UPI003F82884D
MKINDTVKMKSNKGSIVRVIISNFDDKRVKEIKALYSKHGGVDVIRLKDTKPDENGDMKFVFGYAYNGLEDNDTYASEESEKQSLIVTTNDNSTKLHFVKKSSNTGAVLREYTIQGKYETLKSGKVKVTVSINDIKEYDSGNANDLIRSKRTLAQDTNRILLSADTIDYYRQIASGNLDEINNTFEIDSQEIYKINKFLSYRSDMIIYFQMINNFLLYNSYINEIWKYEGKNDVDKDLILNNCCENITSNHSSLINIYSEECKKDDEKINIDKMLVKKDLEKIILLFCKFRHAMLHYDYTFWKSLYSGEEFILTFEKDNNKKVPMSELLNLNIFKELRKIKLAKDKAATNYLNKSSKIYVLGKNVNAIKVLDIYRDICERKLGLNKLVNSIITSSGEENREYKRIVTKHFNDSITNMNSFLKKLEKEDDFKINRSKKRTYNLIKQRYDEHQRLNKWFGGPYVYDIHDSKAYKELYIERKNFVNSHTKLIEKGIDYTNKKDLIEINEKLSKLNKDMKAMTTLNSTYRLQYKMQLFFGFISEKYNLQVDKFLNDFDLNKDDCRKDFIENYDVYINKILEKQDKDLSNLIKDYKCRNTEDIFFEDRDNNLVKLYMVMHLLLPNEIRGDFLGHVKKNYYDMKHVDFINKEDKSEGDTFFHDLRLFEKNARKLEIVDYSLSQMFLSKDDNNYIEEKLNEIILNKNGIELPEDMNIKQFYKAFMLPLMKNYQIIFKLLNDIEIEGLFKISKDENISLEEAINKCRGEKGNIIFPKIMQLALNKESHNKNNIYKIRNSIAHINMKELYIDPLDTYIGINNRETISEKVEHIIERWGKEETVGKELNKSIINDYYMKKEELVLYLKMEEHNNVVIDEQEENKRKETVLRKYHLENKNVDTKIKKTIEKIKELKEASQALGEKDKQKKVLYSDISDLTGIVRRGISLKIKGVLLDIIRAGEYRYVNINVYDKGKRSNVNKEIKIKYCKNKGEKIYTTNFAALDDFNFEINNKSLIIKFDKDRHPEKKVQTINLESNYVQNVKFIVS